jgi:hypothetical protein
MELHRLSDGSTEKLSRVVVAERLVKPGHDQRRILDQMLALIRAGSEQ